MHLQRDINLCGSKDTFVRRAVITRFDTAIGARAHLRMRTRRVHRLSLAPHFIPGHNPSAATAHPPDPPHRAVSETSGGVGRSGTSSQGGRPSRNGFQPIGIHYRQLPNAPPTSESWHNHATRPERA